MFIIRAETVKFHAIDIIKKRFEGVPTDHNHRHASVLLKKFFYNRRAHCHVPHSGETKNEETSFGFHRLLF